MFLRVSNIKSWNKIWKSKHTFFFKIKEVLPSCNILKIFQLKSFPFVTKYLLSCTFLFCREKSEHKTSVWWSNWWVSMIQSSDCLERRATSHVPEGWHAKFPANQPWRKLRTRTTHSVERMRLRSWPTLNCGNIPSLMSRARDRNRISFSTRPSGSQPIESTYLIWRRSLYTLLLQTLFSRQNSFREIGPDWEHSVSSSDFVFVCVFGFSLVSFHWWKLGFVLKVDDRVPNCGSDTAVISKWFIVHVHVCKCFLRKSVNALEPCPRKVYFSWIQFKFVDFNEVLQRIQIYVHTCAMWVFSCFGRLW